MKTRKVFAVVLSAWMVLGGTNVFDSGLQGGAHAALAQSASDGEAQRDPALDNPTEEGIPGGDAVDGGEQASTVPSEPVDPSTTVTEGVTLPPDAVVTDPETTPGPEGSEEPEGDAETTPPQEAETPDGPSAEETPRPASSYAYLAAGVRLYKNTARQAEDRLGQTMAECAVRVRCMGEYESGGAVYEVLFDTDRTAGTDHWETAYFYTENLRSLTPEQAAARPASRTVNGMKITKIDFAYEEPQAAETPEGEMPPQAEAPAETPEESPVTGETPEAGETPAAEETPEAGEIPAAEETPAAGETPTDGEETPVTGDEQENADPEEPQEEDNLFIPQDGVQTPAAEESPEAGQTPEPIETPAAEEEEDLIFDFGQSDPIATLEDQLDPNRKIDIYARWEGDALAFGDTATLYASLTGYDNVEYALQWQTSKDNASWTDVPGATGASCSVTVTEDNYLDYWRVVVSVSDVK